MKKTAMAAIAVPLLWVSCAPAHAFDRVTTEALKACHDYIWMEVTDFKELPNAAVSVFPGIIDEKSVTVFWNVMWDDPIVRAAGNCTVINSVVEGFEDYTKME
jgi:hypothetical protein